MLFSPIFTRPPIQGGWHEEGLSGHVVRGRPGGTESVGEEREGRIGSQAVRAQADAGADSAQGRSDGRRPRLDRRSNRRSAGRRTQDRFQHSQEVGRTGPRARPGTTAAEEAVPIADARRKGGSEDHRDQLRSGTGRAEPLDAAVARRQGGRVGVRRIDQPRNDSPDAKKTLSSPG